MRRDDFTNWIDNIFTTKDYELDCDQTQFHLPAYTEAELKQQLPPEAMATVDTHLQHCPDCAEVYEGLHHVLQAELKGELDFEQTVPQPQLAAAEELAAAAS